MLWLLMACVGLASDWGKPVPYAVPRLSASYVQVNETGTLQLMGGGEAGVLLRDQDTPHWLSQSRLSAVGLYGLGTNSLGGDLRLGSFIGPDGTFARLMTGPDIWYNGYGKPDALDYHLIWSPGVDLRNTVLLKLSEPFRLAGEVTPGWAFVKGRQTAVEELVVFHELQLAGMALIRTDGFNLTVGYRRTWDAVGIRNTLILGASI